MEIQTSYTRENCGDLIDKIQNDPRSILDKETLEEIYNLPKNSPIVFSNQNTVIVTLDSTFDFIPPLEHLLEKLPNRLHLARNDNAEENDRWRFYNIAQDDYISPGYATAKEAMLDLMNKVG